MEEMDIQVEHFTKKETLRLYKNLLIVSFAFMIHFTAFHGTANLQSSVNESRALGTLTLATVYGSLILSNIILPVMVIGRFGCKWTIAISFTAYMPFIMAQFYPTAFTLIPAGLAVGLGGGPLWCAKCTYLTVVSESYAAKTGQSADVLVTRFFGVFFLFYQLAQVWGNLISSSVLSIGSKLVADNETISTFDPRETCGAQFCPAGAAEKNPNFEPPAPYKMHMLAGIYLTCMICAVLSVAFGVDSEERYTLSRTSRPEGTILTKLLATMKQAKDPYQLLLLPATLFIGAEQAFLTASFNGAFVACAWGISKIGFALICFGAFNALGAMLPNLITKFYGRYPVMIVAVLLHTILIITLLTWKPSPDEFIGFFAITGLWGLADSIWLIHINSISGILFDGREEASFSNFRLWESCGSVLVYSCAAYTCVTTQIYIILFIMISGISGYAGVEYLEYRAKKGKPINRGFILVDTAEKRDEKATIKM